SLVHTAARRLPVAAWTLRLRQVDVVARRCGPCCTKPGSRRGARRDARAGAARARARVRLPGCGALALAHCIAERRASARGRQGIEDATEGSADAARALKARGPRRLGGKSPA